MSNKRGFLVLLMCILATAGAFAQQSTQPAAQPIIATADVAPSLIAVEQPVVDSARTASAVAADSTFAEAAPETSTYVKPALTRSQIGAKYDKFHPWDWHVMHFPTIGDTVDPEIGGIRDSLAQHGIGFLLAPNITFVDNLENPPMYGAAGAPYGSVPKGFGQEYNGQKPTAYGAQQSWMTFTSFKTNLQLVVSINDTFTTYEQGFGVTDARFGGIYLNKLLLKNKLIVSAGWVPVPFQSVGLYTGGNMAGSVLGVTAILQNQAGQDFPFAPAPAVTARYDFNKGYYVWGAIQRSNSTWGASNWHDMLYLPFEIPGAKPVYQAELGNRSEAAPNSRFLFERATFIYNASSTFDFTKGPMAFLGYLGGQPYTARKSPVMANMASSNYALSNSIDFQFKQTDPDHPVRGYYIGNTAQMSPTDQNLFTRYLELRGYVKGLFDKRPLDMITVMANYVGFSKPAVADFAVLDSVVLKEAASTSSGQENYAVTYVAHVAPGWWWNAGLEKVTHPTFAPKTPNAFNFTTAITMFF